MKKTKLFNKTLSFDKETENFSDQIITETKAKGRSVGEHNPPKMDCNILKLAYVVFIINNCGQFLNKFSGFILSTIQQEYTSYQQIVKGFLVDNAQYNLQVEKAKFLKAMKKALKLVAKFIKKEVKSAKSEIEVLQNKVKTYTMKLAEMKYTKVFWSIFFSLLLIIGILASEAFVNQKAFLFMKGENFLTSLLIAIGISFCTYLLGLGVSKLIQNRTLDDMRKIALVILLVLVALGAYYGIAVLRVSMMQSLSTGTGRNAFVVSKSTLLLINFGFFVSLILVKLFLFPKPEIFQTNAEILALKKAIKQNHKKIQKLQYEIKNIHQRERQEKDKVQKEYANRIAPIDKELKSKYEDLKRHQVEYNRALSTGINFREEIIALAHKVIGIYIEEINSFRSDNVVLEMPENEISLFGNPFVQYEYINDNEVETLFDNYRDINPFTNENNDNDENNNEEIKL